MQKKFYSNVILIVVLNLLVKPFYLFGIDAQIQNSVGTYDYGMYFSLLNFSFLFNMILDLGLTNYNTKNTAQHPSIVARYIGSILGIKAVLGLTYAAVTIGIGLLLGYNNLQMEILSILVINQFLAGLILYFRSNFAGLHNFKVDAILSVLDRLLLIGICAFLLYAGSTEQAFKIEWFVYAQTGSYGIAVIVGLILTIAKIGVPKIKIKRLYTYAILKKSTPYALLILLMMLYTRIDAVMLERLLPDGKQQAGIYAQGFRLLDAVNIFALLIAGLLLPIFSRLLKQKESIIELLKTSSLLLIGVSSVVGVACSFYAFQLMDLIYHNHAVEASNVFPWIILSFIPISMTYVFGSLLTANGNLALLNKMALGGIILNLFLNFILIPILAVKGAAIATFATQTLTALTQVIFVIYLFKLNWNKKLMIKLIILV